MSHEVVTSQILEEKCIVFVTRDSYRNRAHTTDWDFSGARGNDSVGNPHPSSRTLPAMDQTKLKTKSFSTKAFSSGSGSENAESAFTIKDYHQRTIRCRERCAG